MTTRIEVRWHRGRLVCTLSGSSVRARRIDAPDGRVRVALVATVALLLAGDEVRIEVVVGAGVDLEIVEIAGTVAYDMRGGAARWEIDVRIDTDGFLTWSGLPLVVADGADVTRSTSLSLGSGARAVLRETFVFGRSGQRGGDLAARTDVRHGGRPLLVEDLDLRSGSRVESAVLGRARCLDSVTVLGDRMWSDEPGVLQLAGAGSIDRRLLGSLHDSDLDARCRSAMESVRRSLPSPRVTHGGVGVDAASGPVPGPVRSADVRKRSTW